MKKSVIAAILFFALFHSTASLARVEKPTKCPSENALRKAHFNKAQKQQEGGWTVIDP